MVEAQALCETEKVWKEGQRNKSRGTEEALTFVVCHVSRLCLWNWTTASQLIKLNEIFFFNGCLVLSSLILSCLWRSYWLWSSNSQIECEAIVLSVVYIYNLLTIGFGALCFMHLVLGRSLNIFLVKFFFNGSSHGLSGLGRVDSQKIRSSH